MLKQTCKLLFTGMLLTFANHGVLNTAAHASVYSDIISLPSGNDKLAAEAVNGPLQTTGTPPLSIPAETWIADLNFSQDANNLSFGVNNIWNGVGPAGVMIAGSAKVKTINTIATIGLNFRPTGQRWYCQYTFHFVLYDMQTGAAKPLNSVCPQHSYIY